MNNIDVTPIEAYNARHRQNILTKRPFISKDVILKYSMNKFIMSYNDRDWTWNEEDFSSLFEVGETIYVIPNTIGNHNEDILTSMMPVNLSHEQMNHYLEYLRQNVDVNSNVYNHSQLVPVKIKSIMDLSEDIDGDDYYMHDIEIMTEDNIRLTFYRDIIFKSQSLLEYFSDELNDKVRNKISKRYNNLSRIVLNRKGIPHESGLPSVVSNFLSPRKSYSRNRRSKKGKYVGGKKCKNHKHRYTKRRQFKAHKKK